MSEPNTNPPRGIRNNNPGNIRHSSAYSWLGEEAPDADGFAVFSDPEYGIRAMGVLLRHYYELHSLNTVRRLIERWAPPSENLTGPYAQAVADMCGVGPDEVINVPELLTALCRAIIVHENGYCPYSLSAIADGVQRSAVV